MQCIGKTPVNQSSVACSYKRSRPMSWEVMERMRVFGWREDAILPWQDKPPSAKYGGRVEVLCNAAERRS